MDSPFKHYLIIPKLEMESDLADLENNKELNDQTQSESYYKLVNESLISSNDNNHEDDLNSDSDIYDNKIQSRYHSNNNNQILNKDILIKNADKFFNLNRTKLVKSATSVRNDNDQLEINNSQALNYIYNFSKKQRKKMEEMLPKVELKNYSNKIMSTNKFYKDNERLAKLLETKNLRIKQKSRSISNLEEYSALFQDDLLNKETLNDNIYTRDLDLNRISLLDAKQSDITHKKLSNRTEKINFKKYVVKSMYKKSLDNQRRSECYSASSMEKCLTKQNKNVKKSLRCLDDQAGQVKFKNTSIVDSEMNSMNKLLDINQNFASDNQKKGLANRKSPDDYFQFKIATNKFNSKFEIFKPIYSQKIKENAKKDNNSQIIRQDIDTPTILVTSQIINSSLISIENINQSKYKKYSNHIYNNLNSSLDSNNKINQTIKKSIILRENIRNENLRNIPINMEALIKNNNKRVVESRCISSLWRNYVR